VARAPAYRTRAALETTRDVDLRLIGSGENLGEELRALGAVALDDWLSFEVEPDPQLPRIASVGMTYEGFRFRAEARLSGGAEAGSRCRGMSTAASRFHSHIRVCGVPALAARFRRGTRRSYLGG
jgi:hypothetical protein